MSEPNESGNKSRFSMTGIMITLAITSLMLMMGLISIHPETISAISEPATGYVPEELKASIQTTATVAWGFLAGHANDWRYVWMNNGAINLTMNGGLYYIETADGLVKITKFRGFINTNFSDQDTAVITAMNVKGTMRSFTDSFGTGQDYQLMYWSSSAAKDNVSWYWRMYDNTNFLLQWYEVKNVHAYPINWTWGQLEANKIYSNSGLLVGSSPTTMARWMSTGTGDFWATSGENIHSILNQEGKGFALAFISSSTSEKFLTVGQVTQEFGGNRIISYSSGGDTAYGLQDFRVDTDYLYSAGWTPQEKIVAGANFTSDKTIYSFGDSSSLHDGLGDWTDVVLGLNEFASETKPITGAIWDGWNSYGRNINDTIVRAVADLAVTNYPSIKYIEIDDGWQLEAGTVLGKDTLAMEIDTVKFPDLTATAAYIHSKGLKVNLWVAPGMMTFTGAMNASHPEWRTKNYPANGGYWNYSGAGFAYWHADISNPAYLAYLQSQLLMMQNTYGIDGFKLDFQSYPSGSEKMQDWNHSAIYSIMRYWTAIKNGTVDAEMILAGLPLSRDIFASRAFNMIRTGIDVTSYATLYAGFTTYFNVEWFSATSQHPDKFARQDLDMITEWYRTYGMPLNYVQTHANLVYAMGSVVEFSFRKEANATFEAAIGSLRYTVNLTGDHYAEGQNAADHKKLPNVYGRNGGGFSGGSPNISVALVNWNTTAGQTITFHLSDLNITSSTYLVFNVNTSSFERLSSSSYSLTLTKSGSVLLAISEGTSSNIMFSTVNIINGFQFTGNFGLAMLVFYCPSALIPVTIGNSSASVLSGVIVYEILNMTTVKGTSYSLSFILGVASASQGYIFNFLQSGNDYNWTAIGSGPGAVITFTLSGLVSGTIYKVYVDGGFYQNLIASSGTITFTYSGPWSEHQFEVISGTWYSSSTHSLIQIALLFLAVGMVVSVIAEISVLAKRKTILSSAEGVKTILTMVICLVVGLVLIRLAYGVLG